MDLIARAAKRIADTQPSVPSEPERQAPGSEPVPPRIHQGLEDSSQEPREPRISIRDETGDKQQQCQSRSVEIDVDRIERLGFLSPRHPVSRNAEEFRVLKRWILTKIVEADADRAGTSRIAMVTSSQPREGKTFTAINLALSIAAERDRHVLLIDVDFSHPAVFNLLGLKRTRGFLDVLRDPDLDLGDVIWCTNVEHLSLIDAGRSSVNASEFLSSERMQRLVTEIANRYEDRIIIFDTPPMLATSQASILSHHVGQILLVVEAGKTSQRAVKAALDLIYDRDKVVMVLNKAKSLPGSEDFGSYHYYYQPAGVKSNMNETKPKSRRRLLSRS